MKAIKKPWGNYLVLCDQPGYKVKQLTVEPGGQLSLQSHLHRDEHWVIVEGEATIIVGASEQTFCKGDSIHVPAGCHHRITNNSEGTVIIIEVQIGEYLGEDDITRYEDKYGRL